MANGINGVRLLRTGVLTAKKLLVVPVSAMAWNVGVGTIKGGPTEEVAFKHVQIVVTLLLLTISFSVVANKTVGSPRS
jgi:hypothetical protein